VNLHYGDEYRSDPEALRNTLLPVASSGSVAQPENHGCRSWREFHGEDDGCCRYECSARDGWPLVMTVATAFLGLLPLLWESGLGAEVSARTAAPGIGGLWSCMFLTLLVFPAA